MHRSEADFVEIALSNTSNRHLLDRLASLTLPHCMLTAGCLFQPVWNSRDNRAPDWGIKDYDVFYFDPADLSWEAEDAAITQTQNATADLNINVEVRNQARVHLWYAEKFGHDYPALTSVQDGVDRFLISGTCIGIDVQTRQVYAPFGLTDMWEGLLRMNPNNPSQNLFEAKARHYQERWPWLRTVH